jgi:hypothetical protein
VKIFSTKILRWQASSTDNTCLTFKAFTIFLLPNQAARIISLVQIKANASGLGMKKGDVII